MPSAIVTGGARGIGKAIALELAQKGYDVLINFSSDLDASSILEELGKHGTKAYAFRADISKESEVENLLAFAKSVFPSLDVLVNNAGITRDGLLFRMKEEDFDQVININLKGAFLTCKHMGRWMSSAKKGSIINVSSIIGLIGNAGQANYAASKAGMIALTQSVGKELGPRGVRCNAVAPGFIDTAMTDKLSVEVKDNYLRQIPLGRFGQAQEVAKVVSFLASNDAGYINCEVIKITGGL